MDNPDFELAEAEVVIIGLGLMGGSTAAALSSKCRRLAGMDPDAGTIRKVNTMNLLDAAGTEPEEILPGADLVILACPVPAILSWLLHLPEYIQDPCIVLDLGSTKGEITDAMDNMPENFSPIGGHPICGKESAGLQNASADIFQEAAFVLCPTEKTTRKAEAAALQVVGAVGSYPILRSSAEHDRQLAFTSHLPYLLSAALMSCVPESTSDIHGSGFKSAARLAGTSTTMMTDIMQSSRRNILEAVRHYIQELMVLENLLEAEDYANLTAILDTSRDRYWNMRKEKSCA